MRILTFMAAMTALLAAAPAGHAQAKECSKVEVNFSCGNGVSGGPGLFACRAGEREADCCKRWQKSAGNSWCRGNGGLAGFLCKCPATLTPVDPPQRTLTPVDPPQRTLTPVDPPQRTLTPVDPPQRTLTPVDPPRRTLTIAECHRIKYSFTCFNGASSSGKFACGGKETKARCCRRAQQIAHRGCRNKGMAIRFACTCLPKKKQDKPGKLQFRRR